MQKTRAQENNFSPDGTKSWRDCRCARPAAVFERRERVDAGVPIQCDRDMSEAKVTAVEAREMAEVPPTPSVFARCKPARAVVSLQLSPQPHLSSLGSTTSALAKLPFQTYANVEFLHAVVHLRVRRPDPECRPPFCRNLFLFFSLSPQQYFRVDHGHS